MTGRHQTKVVLIVVLIIRMRRRRMIIFAALQGRCHRCASCADAARKSRARRHSRSGSRGIGSADAAFATTTAARPRATAVSINHFNQHRGGGGGVVGQQTAAAFQSVVCVCACGCFFIATSIVTPLRSWAEVIATFLSLLCFFPLPFIKQPTKGKIGEAICLSRERGKKKTA
jgi:hypothetical protein